MRIFSEENAKSAQELILDLKSDLDPESVVRMDGGDDNQNAAGSQCC